MGVGRQSRRVCFGAKPDKGFLDKKISPYPEVVRGRERELTTRPSREAVCGWRPGVGSWWQESRERVAAGDHGGQWRLDKREAVGGWTRERQLVVGQERGELVAGPENESWWLDPRMRVDDATQREAVGGWRPAEELVAGQEKGQLRLDKREANSRSWRGRAEGQSTPDTGTERRGDKIGPSEEESQDV